MSTTEKTNTLQRTRHPPRATTRLSILERVAERERLNEYYERCMRVYVCPECGYDLQIITEPDGVGFYETFIDCYQCGFAETVTDEVSL